MIDEWLFKKTFLFRYFNYRRCQRQKSFAKTATLAFTHLYALSSWRRTIDVWYFRVRLCHNSWLLLFCWSLLFAATSCTILASCYSVRCGWWQKYDNTSWIWWKNRASTSKTISTTSIILYCRLKLSATNSHGRTCLVVIRNRPPGSNRHNCHHCHQTTTTYSMYRHNFALINLYTIRMVKKSLLNGNKTNNNHNNNKTASCTISIFVLSNDCN